MNRVIFPFAAAVVVIISLSLVEGVMRDRWATPGVEASEVGQRFQQVPIELGDWVGEDLPVDMVTKSTAGAVNYVSRRYVNRRTKQEVTLWLIVGHSRDICRHTPDVCYPNQGFRRVGSQLKHPIPITDTGRDADFYTAMFSKEDPAGRHDERVFWSWNRPDTNLWEAPVNPRFHYGLSRALYKVYFVSRVPRDENTIAGNAAVEFAELMLPALNKALFPQQKASSAEVEATPEA
ncbi:MAG: EpsI family protein [Pirellulales bacterium]|nr:EpsI family protein [Pirellulales bacterium]